MHFQLESLNESLSEFESRLLLKQAQTKANGLAESLYLTSNLQTHNIVKVAHSMGMNVVIVSYDEIYPIIDEAVSGFKKHVSAQGRKIE